MASDKIRGIAIEISGDTSKLVKSLKDVDSSVKSTQKQLKDVDRLLKLDPKNTELLAQKQKLLAQGVEQTNKKLEELNKIQKEMDAQGIDKNSEQYQALQREIISTEQEVKNLEQATKNFGSVGVQHIAGIGKELQSVGGKIEEAGQKMKVISAAAAGAEAAMVGIGLKAITTADDLNTMAAQTGLSTAEIQKFQYASDRIDVPLETMTGALAKMKKNMTGQPELWKALGVSVTEWSGGPMRNATDVFYQAIEALSKIENETLRDQVAMQLFGKSADQLAGIIDDGGASLRAYGQEAEQMGLILSDEVLGSLNATNDQIDKAKAQLQAGLLQLGATIAQVLAPIIEKLAAFVQKVVQFMQSLTPQQAKLIMIIVGIVAALGPLLIIVGKLISSIGMIMTFAPMIVSGIGTVMSALSGLFGLIAANPIVLVIGAIIAAVVALTILVVKNIDTIKAALRGLGQFISNLFRSIGQAIVNFFTGIVNLIRNMVQAIWNMLKSLFSFGASVAASFGGGGIGGSHIRGMAVGGTISSGAALVGENGPELLTMVGNKAQITPLTTGQAQSALSSVANGGGNTVVTVNFTGSLAQLARILQPEIKAETVRRGLSMVRG